jgi:hypothetical protein
MLTVEPGTKPHTSTETVPPLPSVPALMLPELGDAVVDVVLPVG